MKNKIRDQFGGKDCERYQIQSIEDKRSLIRSQAGSSAEASLCAASAI
ncbi:hypothetical protein HFN78_31775 [Rhizobium laguerreae]|nr:hypothetical protein [Rhizobium laguerreae]MBY3299911.1 hypothetical protein [Rhizobium laguerreae]MBY3424608.1 hypothetical protein [Rhizobium laguerreae]MBY3475447.1 hypothetical protein [Rhizobium laguerreae]MBY3496255.1 hypothetical protein [Rhizobium laguerreae]MBY3523622.1 hypothetical protein [Rhizobium laguerreae]